MPTLTDRNLTSSSLTSIDTNKKHQEDASNTLIKVKTPKTKHKLLSSTVHTDIPSLKFKSRSPSPSLVVLLANKVNAAAASTSSSFRMPNGNNHTSIKSNQQPHAAVNRAHSLKIPRTNLTSYNSVSSEMAEKNLKKVRKRLSKIKNFGQVEGGCRSGLFIQIHLKVGIWLKCVNLRMKRSVYPKRIPILRNSNVTSKS